MAGVNASLSDKVNKLYFKGITLYKNGTATNNQACNTLVPINDFELFQVTIGWQTSLCLMHWYNDTHNQLSGSHVYAGPDFCDFYQYEIVFTNTSDTQSFYINVLSRVRIYANGRYEYDDTTIVLNGISGLKVVPRPW